jgi:hypothetical protein
LKKNFDFIQIFFSKDLTGWTASDIIITENLLAWLLTAMADSTA